MAFGVNTTGIPLSGSGMEVTDYSSTPRAYSTADALDEGGDVAARTYYGGDADILECTATLVLKSGTAPTSVTLGAATGTGVSQWIESLEIATSNSQWPTYTVKWREGLTNVTGSAYTVSLPTLQPLRRAQPIGVSLDGTNARITATSASYTCTYSEQLDDHGEYAASAFSGGVATSGADAVVITGSATWEAETGWTSEDGGSAITETNTDYATSSASVSKYLTANSSAA